jgi:hypothetical protein
MRNTTTRSSKENILSLLHEKEMHSRISQHNETRSKDSQPDCIRLQRSVVETERAQDGSAGYFNIKTIFVVDQTQSTDFIDN